MVMEAPPSPQSVGREFVRQYYTLLNKAPTHLHRFYNHQSSFVHGGLDPPNRETSPVIGQKQIHQKIQQLNFRDCHAKITQVDSQATLGNGVVVQVTGELSNAGQPMRRFTQTFVLAAQSPKKYYVHNDIFRYQDEIISDEDCDGDVRSDPGEDINSDRPVLGDVPQMSPQGLPPYFPSAALQGNLPQVAPHLHSAPPHVLTSQVPTVNGAVHPDDLSVLGGPVPQPLGPPLPQPLQQTGLVQSLNPPPAQIEEPAVLDEPVEEPEEPPVYDEGFAAEQEPELPVESASNEPKTWANLLKSPSDKSSSMPYGSLPAQSNPLPMSQPMRPTSPPSGNQGLGLRNNSNRSGPRTNQQQQQPRVPRQDSGRGLPGRNSMNEEGEERRRPQGMNFSNDVNQLFLGNLPHSATEDDLREIFAEFGTVVDLKVHSKPNNKMSIPPGGRAPPNYGFITYDSQQGVQNCLSHKPIFFPKNDKTGTLLNVEEKKLKDRPSYGGGRPNSDQNRGPRGDNNGQRRGGGGGGLSGGPPRNNGGLNGPNNRTYNNRGGGGGGGPGGPMSRPNTYNNRR
ncbi:unnamed protein product [Brassicogethes aeneus]|uniref:Ras GTPase-activating protein-binding protein 2 n=1 Tax=Brassicogethes aeneus TaxID=1431903 RepID=A0A9P0BAP3_BRAAE|nr:unnamed protein product [Brassicogethes aeneus]